MFWNLYQDMDELRRNLDRAFGSSDKQRRPFSRFSFLPGLAARRYPLINMSQDADNVYVEALAPGLDIENLDLSVLNNTLTIAGEKIASGEDIQPEALHRSERATGRFIRTIELNTVINEDKVEASYVNGILTMTLPKAEVAKPRRIAINAG